MFLGLISVLKVIFYLYYDMVVLGFYFFKIYLIDNENEILYNRNFFFWSGGYLFWEISSGGIWVIKINVF